MRSVQNTMKHNFNSGPSILPLSVLEKASQAIMDFNGSGLSILEIGHRSPAFVEVMEEARALTKSLMGLGDEHETLFLQGGATTQFMQVPMNLLTASGTAAYCDDGTWGNKAIKEAALFGPVATVATSKDKGYTYINKSFTVPEEASYLHITSNNTVEGTQWHRFPDTNAPLIADMSSDIFSRTLDFSRFSLIYAGAQKNMGAAGVTVVVVNKELLGKTGRSIPAIMDYRKHIEAGSLLNTPPVFAVYVSLLTMRWIKEQGGLSEMEKRADKRANLLYGAIDALPIFQTKVNKEDRSKMNAVFFLKDAALEVPFLEMCKKEGMVGVKGYRTVGGIRVSMYNAMPLSSVQAFVDLMHHFANSNG